MPKMRQPHWELLEPEVVAERIANCIENQLEELEQLTTSQLLDARYQRLLSYGEYQD